MKELIIFTGNVGCGKSCKAKEFANLGYIIINDDAITTMIGGGDYTLYDELKKPIYKNLEIVGICTSLNYNFSVVIDKPNMTKEKREKLIKIGKLYDARLVSYDWGPGNLEDLNRRLMNDRGYNKWVKAFDKKRKDYEEPEMEEGFDEIIRLR